MKTLLSRRRSELGITLVETMVAAGVSVAAIAGLSASTQQASRIARAGKDIASASEMIQERIECFRSTPFWRNITTSTGITSVASASTAIASNFQNVTETFRVQPYPTGSELVVTRSPNGSFTNNGVDVSASKCVKFTVTATWTASGNNPQSRQFSTIIAKGGL